MMLIRIFSIAVAAVLVCSCESEFKVYVEDFSPTPSIYCLINPTDSVHHIRVERSFFSNQDPTISGMSDDSLYFDDVNVEVRLIKANHDTTFISAYKNESPEKRSGYFGQQNHRVYSFNNVLAENWTPLYSKIEVAVTVPGLPTAVGSSDLLSRPIVRWPRLAQQYLYMDSTRPILVQWNGEAWNEADITFTVMEQYEDSVVSQTVSFEEKTEIFMVEGVVQVTFPYELVVTNLTRLLDSRKDVVRRFFGPVLIKIHAGNQDFSNYIKYKDGLNDFSGRTYSNFENGIGMIACKWSFPVRPLTFDHWTRQTLANDQRLKKFKFIEY